jgi:hypothetical protein
MAVLKNLQQEKELAEQELAALRSELAALKARADKGLTFKVSQKGAVSVYGLGRWPVTLYAGQWETLLASASDIEAFIDGNRASLSFKD